HTGRCGTVSRGKFRMIGPVAGRPARMSSRTGGLSKTSGSDIRLAASTALDSYSDSGLPGSIWTGVEIPLPVRSKHGRKQSFKISRLLGNLPKRQRRQVVALCALPDLENRRPDG